MKPSKMSRANNGVKCSVDACHYYMTGDQCSAEKIEVGPKNALNVQETDCTTFTPGDKA